MTKGRVHVVQSPRQSQSDFSYDLSPALPYGVISTIFAIDFQPSHNIERALEILDEALEDFDPDKDYFVWIGGDPAGLVLLTSWLSSHDIESVQFLRWDKDRNRNNAGKGYYLPYRLPIKLGEI